MTWFERLVEELERAFGIGAYASTPPLPTVRQVVTPAPGGEPHAVPAAPVAVTSADLVVIINAHRRSYSNEAKGVSIVAPTDEQVAVIADLLHQAADVHEIHVEFLAAAMCQESLFAVDCRNGNYLGRNPGKTNEGTDWGVGQINGANLASEPGMEGLTWPQMIAKVMTPEWAVPQFCRAYAGLVQWADGIVAFTDTGKPWAAERDAIYAGGSAVDPKWQNPYWLAALAYNRGRRGALAEIAVGTVVPHPDHVAAYCNSFTDATGTTRLMPDEHGINA